MKTLLIALALIIPLAGCGITEPLHGPDAKVTESAEVHAARTAIDEANAILEAVNQVIGDNAAAGVWTKVQAQGYLDQSKDLGKRLDEARGFLRLGNPAEAQARTQAIKTAILALQLEISKRAREEQ